MKFSSQVLQKRWILIHFYVKSDYVGKQYSVMGWGWVAWKAVPWCLMPAPKCLRIKEIFLIKHLRMDAERGDMVGNFQTKQSRFPLYHHTPQSSWQQCMEVFHNWTTARRTCFIRIWIRVEGARWHDKLQPPSPSSWDWDLRGLRDQMLVLAVPH